MHGGVTGKASDGLPMSITGRSLLAAIHWSLFTGRYLLADPVIVLLPDSLAMLTDH
jgi:hypothetical protein